MTIPISASTTGVALRFENKASMEVPFHDLCGKADLNEAEKDELIALHRRLKQMEAKDALVRSIQQFGLGCDD